MPEDNGHRQEKRPPVPISPIVPGRPGRPSFSLDALREHVERQFQEETADRTDILSELDTEDKRRALLEEITDYVLAVEAITLTGSDRRTLIDRAYRNLFTFGPLDDYLRDDSVTEITIDGPYDIHVRHGLGKLVSVETAFDDRAHLESILRRVLAVEGPFLETGLMVEGRAVRFGLIAPPVSLDYHLEIRLHPRQPLTLDDLHTRFDAVSPQAAGLLKSTLAAGRGLLIVGDAGLGKTTLAAALVRTLPHDAPLCVVERAAEMCLQEQVTHRIPSPTTSFMSEIQNALDEAPAWLIVDEIRGDEAESVCAALMEETTTRYLWVFRGDSQPERLHSALGMVIRKQKPALTQSEIDRALVRHLPVVAAFKRIEGKPRLHLIAEWVVKDETLNLRPLLATG